jgi:hypothetical protein
MLHPDGQYEPSIIPQLVEADRARGGDIVLGSRFLDPEGARKGGMPWWKRAANRFLTESENRLMGTELSELHTGYRAFSRKLLLEVPFLRNSLDFAFDTELLMQARTSASASTRCRARRSTTTRRRRCRSGRASSTE